MHLVNCHNCIFTKFLSNLTDIPDICFKDSTTAPPDDPLEGFTGLGVIVLTAVVGVRKEKDPSGGVWRNPHTGFLSSFSPTRQGHMEFAPFSSSEMRQHVYSVSAPGSPLETRG